MTTPSLRPDPGDPANDPWWRLHDRLDVIGHDASRIAAAALTARLRLCAGGDPRLADLTGLLAGWSWEDRPLDVPTETLEMMEEW